MVHLMNCAVMTNQGTYRVKKIPLEEFCKLIQEAHAGNNLISHLGYDQAIEYVRKNTGIRFPFNRDRTELADGDVMLILRLAYRISDPSTKRLPQREDYEFLSSIFKIDEDSPFCGTMI
jgi:hypothetical protein